MMPDASKLPMGTKSSRLFSLVWRFETIVCLNFRTREVQCRDREALFGQTTFEIPLFGIAQPGLEQTLIAINISQMRTQTGNSLFHNTLSCIHIIQGKVRNIRII